MLPISRPRRSFLFSIAVTFALGYAVSNLAHFAVSNLRFYEDFNEERTLATVNHLKLGATLLKHDEIDGLTRQLNGAREAGQIDFFLLRKGQQILSFGNAENDLKAIDIAYVPNRMVVDERKSYGSVGIGDYLLAVGVYKGKTAYLREMFHRERGSIVFDCFVVILMAVGIVVFFFRDIRELLQIIRLRDRKGLQGLKTGSTTEAIVMAQGLRAYESQIHGLRVEKNRLYNQVQPSLRTELDLGLEPPYQFRCIMVRTDINQYSTIYATYPVEEFMAVINEFFTRASAIIDRYQGYVTDFVGDEIIYYFKEDEHQNAAAIALAAIRDVHAIAEDLHRRTLEQNGYPFRVKSAVACGSLRFGRQVNSFALSGGVFVETVRILSQVEEKSQNSVYLPSRLALRTIPVCRTEPKKAIELRGIPGVSQLYTVTDFRDCATTLADLTETTASALQNFRSDTDLLLILKKLRETCQSSSGIGVCRNAVQALRLLATPSPDLEVRDAFCRFLTELLDRWSTSEEQDARKLVSAAIMLTTKVVAREVYDETLRALLARCLSSGDRRILSNGIDAFIYFEPAETYEMLSKLIKHPDNRVMANALIKQGLSHLDERIIGGLRTMIRSSDPLYQASGAFAAGEIARFYRAEDLTFYETHLSFRRLLNEVAELVGHSNEMVHRQAEAALKKARIEISKKLSHSAA